MAAWTPSVSLAGMLCPSWFSPLQSPLAGLAQNPFSAASAGTAVNQLGLALEGQLIGRFGFRGRHERGLRSGRLLLG